MSAAHLEVISQCFIQECIEIAYIDIMESIMDVNEKPLSPLSGSLKGTNVNLLPPFKEPSKPNILVP